MFPVIYTIPKENHGRCGRVADTGTEDVSNRGFKLHYCLIPLIDWSGSNSYRTQNLYNCRGYALNCSRFWPGSRQKKPARNDRAFFY